MNERGFWQGFGAGFAAASVGIAGAFMISKLRRSEDSNVVRLEKSVQIGRPVEEVFSTWSRIEQLPRFSELIESVQRFGSRSHWSVNINGKRFEWNAEEIQNIPNQAIGWKSIGEGPKHTGRINFSPLGSDTLVHVVMNYAPPAGAFGRGLFYAFGELDKYVEEALRDFKAALEGKGQETTGRATGTFGAQMQPSGETNTREDNPVDYTRPPEKPY